MLGTRTTCIFAHRETSANCPHSSLCRPCLSWLRFYYDRTHKGNDWNAVKSRLSTEIASGKKSEKVATKEMLALLKDKYSRYGAVGRGVRSM